MSSVSFQQTFIARDYDLGATLTSGQAFRWRQQDGWWEGVIDSWWVRLRQTEAAIIAETATDPDDWRWLSNYLQLSVDLETVLRTFPNDEPMRAAVQACKGLRLLRQDPWECLASFILSSTKQIIQIQQIVALLCQRLGSEITTPSGHAQAFAFPSAERLAVCAERDLRDCKMGFRAPNLLRTAQLITRGEVNLNTLHTQTVEDARAELIKLPGVGNKIANCVLLFAYGFQQAFPVDVWVRKALRDLYFPKRRPSEKRLNHFAATHFGPNAGYAQQYLFHFMRTHRQNKKPTEPKLRGRD